MVSICSFPGTGQSHNLDGLFPRYGALTISFPLRELTLVRWPESIREFLLVGRLRSLTALAGRALARWLAQVVPLL